MPSKWSNDINLGTSDVQGQAFRGRLYRWSYGNNYEMMGKVGLP